MSHLIDIHPTDAPKSKLGNPAVVGLAGFAVTTFVLQVHNLGGCGLGPVVALGMVYGGGAQLIAGFLEMMLGNNFGFCAFVGYGSFWISLCSMLLFKQYKVYPIGHNEIGWLLVSFTIFTLILFVGTFRRSKGEVFLFGSLLLGFILLVLEKFVGEQFLKPASWTLIITSLTAFYACGHAVLKDIFGYDILPMGINS